MIDKPAYTEFHPRWYRTRVSTYWWLGRWPFVKFILRELSSIFVAFVVVITLLQIRALGRGPQAYQAFQDLLGTPLMLVLNIISLLFVLFHTITWFNLTPKAVVLRVRGKRLPDGLIIAPNYIAWLVVSAVVAWIVTGG
jgi:fumarate reductase subunit C